MIPQLGNKLHIILIKSAAANMVHTRCLVFNILNVYSIHDVIVVSMYID